MPISTRRTAREEVVAVVCERCTGRGFELVGVEPGGVVLLQCARCGRVEHVVADPRPPVGSDADGEALARYRARR